MHVREDEVCIMKRNEEKKKLSDSESNAFRLKNFPHPEQGVKSSRGREIEVV